MNCKKVAFSFFLIVVSISYSYAMENDVQFFPKDIKASKMEYVDVCKDPKDSSNCIKISRLIMGTDHVGKLPEKEAEELFNKAIELGINTFDTAPIYIYNIESRLGKWLKSQDRSKIFVLTKGGFPKDLKSGATYSSRLKETREQIVENISEEIEGSLSHLGAITIYLMHRDDVDFIDYKKVSRPQTPVKTILEALSDPKLRSKYIMVGVSNWDTDRVNQAQLLATSNPDLILPVFNSPYFSLLEMNDSVTIHLGGIQVKHDDMMNKKFQEGVKLMTYSPLGGFPILSKGWNEAEKMALKLKDGTSVENMDAKYWRRVYDSIFNSANKKRIERALKITEMLNKEYPSKSGKKYTLDQILNAYVLAHERADFLVIGPTSIEQLERTVEALEISKYLTKEHLNYLYQNEMKSKL